MEDLANLPNDPPADDNPRVSLNALTALSFTHLIRVQASVKGKMVSMLMDGVSSHNFIATIVAMKISLNPKHTDSLSV